MVRAHVLGTPLTHPITGARVNMLVVNHEISALRRGGEQGLIGGVAAAEIKRRFDPKKIGGSLFQGFVLGMIAAQKTRSARAHRHSARESRARGIAQFFGMRQSEIVIGRKVESAKVLQRTTSTDLRQALQVGCQIGKGAVGISGSHNHIVVHDEVADTVRRARMFPDLAP